MREVRQNVVMIVGNAVVGIENGCRPADEHSIRYEQLKASRRSQDVIEVGHQRNLSVIRYDNKESDWQRRGELCIARIAELRAGTKKAEEACPESPSQHRLLSERAARHRRS